MNQPFLQCHPLFQLHTKPAQSTSKVLNCFCIIYHQFLPHTIKLPLIQALYKVCIKCLNHGDSSKQLIQFLKAKKPQEPLSIQHTV